MRKQQILFILIGVAISVGLIAAYQSRTQAPPVQSAPTIINSYEKCAAAGNPILESYPEQCVTKDGKHFTRILSDDEQKNLQP